MTKQELETPALLTDLPSMESNLRRMAAFFQGVPAKLRPHFKNHKCPDLADPAAPVEVGDKIEIWVHYTDATVKLHDRIYGIRDGQVEEVFRVEG